MSDAFDPENIRMGADFKKAYSLPKKKNTGLYQPIKGEQFLKGPIPWHWLCLAAEAPGKALHIAIFLWRLAGLQKTLSIALNQSRVGNLGVARDSARRGLRALEIRKLVLVVREPGRRPVVTILLAPAPINENKTMGSAENG